MGSNEAIKKIKSSTQVRYPHLLVLITLLLCEQAKAYDKLGLVLPTNNRALFDGNLSSFYMYTDREFEGKKSRPWSGGKYGFVRDQKRTNQGVIYTRFHEGIDIAPVSRDKSGHPTDRVHSILPGKTVYTNTSPGRSSYGK